MATEDDIVKRVQELAGSDLVKKLMAKVGWSDRVGGLVRDLGDGREVQCCQQLYNFRISIGPAGGDRWTDSW